MIIPIALGLALTLGLAGAGRAAYRARAARADDRDATAGDRAVRRRIRRDATEGDRRRNRALVLFRGDAPKITQPTWVDPRKPDRISLFRVGWRVLPPIVAGGVIVITRILYH